MSQYCILMLVVAFLMFPNCHSQTSPTTDNSGPTTISPSTIFTDGPSSTINPTDPTGDTTTINSTTPYPATTDSTTTTNTTTSFNQTTTEQITIPFNQTSATTVNATTPTTPIIDHTTPTTTLSTTTVTTTTPSTCTLKCVKTDSSGIFWSICANHTEFQDCETYNSNSTGKVSWACLSTGQFATPEPDYTNCSSRWLNDLIERVPDIEDTSSAIIFLNEMIHEMLDEVDGSEPRANYFGHEIESAFTLLTIVTDVANNDSTTVDEFQPVAEGVVRVTENLVKLQQPWRQLVATNRSIFATNLIDIIETATFSLTGKVDNETVVGSEYTKYFTSANTDTFVAAGLVVALSDDEPLEFPSSDSGVSRDSFLTILPGRKPLIASWAENGFVECVGIIVGPENGNLMLPGQFDKLGLMEYNPETRSSKKILNGKVISFTVLPPNGVHNELYTYLSDGHGARIQFRHTVDAWGDRAFDIRRKLKPGETPKAAMGSATCVYWDTTTLSWSPDGCKLILGTKDETICECDHLTSFAVLMDLHNYVGKSDILEIFTLIFSPISILCLLLSILVLSIFAKTVQNERNSITINLCCCLIVGNILVLTTLTHHDYMSEVLCDISGILTHYIFLAAFCWMALEGIQLYKMVIKVFDTVTYSFWINYFLAYGISLGVVGITAAVGYATGNDPYGGEDVCWLNGNYIWTFIGPVLFVILTNLVILIICVWKAYRIRNAGKFRKGVSSFLTLTRGCISLTVLLGLTWIFGYLALIPGGGLAFSFIFVLLNASQGIFIFVFRVLLNEKVHQVILRKYGHRLPHRIANWLRDTPPTSNEPSHNNMGNNAQHQIPKRPLTLYQDPSSISDPIAQAPPEQEVPYYAKFPSVSTSNDTPFNIWKQRKEWFHSAFAEQNSNSSKSSASIAKQRLDNSSSSSARN